jgi:hypothetical protein
MRTLRLTSPNAKGPDVRKAQQALKSGGYWVGKVDGVFGEMTARACTQARYTLGYRMVNVKPVYDKTLHDFLTQKKQTNLLMKQRAKQRVSKQPMREQALKIAMSFRGTKESPANSNKVLFSTWYGMIGPWCAMFITYAYVQAGSKAFKKGSHWAYCPYMLADARAQRNGLTIVPADKVQPGDIVLFDWQKDGVPDHVGLVIKPPVKGKFTAVEGNTSVGNNSNGGEVMFRERNTTQVAAFVRVVA